MKPGTQSIGYLSGAPSVSTSPDAENPGPRNHILGVMNAFKRLGWEVKPFILGDRVPEQIRNAIPQSKARKNFITRLLSDILRIISGFINRNNAYRQIGDVSLVYERFGSFQALGRKFKKKGITWVLETNGPFFAEASQERKSLVLTGIARKMELLAYQKCDYLLCVSEELKRIITSQLGIDPQKIIVIPNGVDSELFSPDKYVPPQYFDFPTIGYVGKVIERQGLDILVQAIAEIKEEQGIKIGLVVVGHGAYQETLISLVNQYHLNEQVNFLGRVTRDKVPECISGFDLGYSGQTIISDGILNKMYHSPLKLYEYLSMGKPVIAAAYDDANRVIRQDETGFLFNSGDKESLKTTILHALDRSSKWYQMGRVARQEMVDHNSWEHRVSNLLRQIGYLNDQVK